MKQRKIDSEVGGIIVMRLRQMGKTQRWLADVLGSTPASINGLIKGRYKPFNHNRSHQAERRKDKR